METPAILRRNVADICPAVTDMGKLNRAAGYASLVKSWLRAHGFTIVKGNAHNCVEAHDATYQVRFTYRENAVRAELHLTIHAQPITLETFERYLAEK